MLYVLMIHIVMDIFDIMISMINHLLYVIIIMLIYGIKMISKMAIFLTIQKPNFRYFSVRGFAAVLKPDPFDGKNFLIWKAKWNCGLLQCLVIMPPRASLPTYLLRMRLSLRLKTTSFEEH
jgi:hypothetical protein